MAKYVLSLMMCLLFSITSYAATPSDADPWIGDDGELVADATPANAESIVDRFMDYPQLYVANHSIVPYAQVIDTKTGKWITNVSGEFHHTSVVNGVPVDFYTFPKRPSGSGLYNRVGITLPKKYFPSPGKYGLQITMYEGEVHKDMTKAYCGVYASENGVRTAVDTGSSDILYSGTKFTGKFDVEIGYKTSNITLSFLFYQSSDGIPMYGVAQSIGSLAFFDFQSNGTTPIVSPEISAGVNSGSVIADSSQQIAQSTASMADTLKEIVKTISNQLAALWDQMFNLMHVPHLRNDDKNTNLIINKLGEDLNVQIQNDNDNTNTLINGYDKSGMEADNEKLNSAITEYDKAEESVLDSVNDSLNNFEFSGSITSYVTAVSTISGFLQKLYESAGGFRDVINIAFFLAIASTVIGMYRIRGA